MRKSKLDHYREVAKALAEKGLELPPETDIKLRGRSSQVGVVYFIQCGEFIKIGRTTNRASFRVAELQCGNPYPLTLLATVQAHRNSLVELEAAYHSRFDRYRHRDEWFTASPELLDCIREIQRA